MCVGGSNLGIFKSFNVQLLGYFARTCAVFT